MRKSLVMVLAVVVLAFSLGGCAALAESLPPAIARPTLEAGEATLETGILVTDDAEIGRAHV